MSKLLRVVKTGGSLFDLPDLPLRLRAWHVRQPPGYTLFLAGLGDLGEAIRQYDARFQLTAAASHAICLEALTTSARLLAALLPDAVLIADGQSVAAREFKTGPEFPLIFLPTPFLTQVEPTASGEALPAGWDVTSDSIAARVAELLHADELVLLKSRLPGPFSTLAELADSGYVDRYFPWAMKSLGEVRFVNLRDDHYPEVFGFE